MKTWIKQYSCRIIVLGIAVFSLFESTLSGQVSNDFDKKIESRNREILRLVGEKKNTLGKIEQFKKREWRVLEILNVINDSIASNRKKLIITIDKIAELQIQLRETNKNIGRLNKEIEIDKDKISRQINALLYLGRVRQMTPILGVNSFKYYFRNQKLLQSSTKVDIALFDRLSLNLNELQTQKDKRQKQWLALLALKKTEEAQKELLSFERQQQYTYLLHLREDRESRMKYLGEIEIELERLNEMIYSLELERETQIKLEQFKGFGKLDRLLPAPVTGKLVHRFEQQGSIFYTLYKRGVLVETPKNEEVRCILAGKVVWVGPFRGYHNLVIVDHGKGSFSVYGNLDEIYVIRNETIDPGELLGTVAYNIQEKRYLFYFETRLNKTAVDPIQWLAKPVWR